MKQETKQSMILGALTGSAGIFITKLIGLIYVIPFHALIGPENGVYYAYAYRVYGYLLNVTMAGFPFAIATMVAKYMVKEEYDMIVAVRRISFWVMGIIGAIIMLAVVLFATPIAHLITNVSADAVATTANVLKIIALALLVVPILGVYRGFYQGLKELHLYASNQVLEQLVRVGFLLAAGYIAVHLFHLEPIYGVYFAVLSAAVSALIAIIHIKRKDHTIYRDMKQSVQTPLSKVRIKQVLSELLRYATPFMVVSVLGNSYYLFDMLVFERAMVAHGVAAQAASSMYGMINFQVDKLTSIPMVIAPGFSLAIIPYITSSYVLKDWKTVARNISDALALAMYIVLPLTLVLMSLGTPIYYSMYYDNYQIGGQLLSWYSLDGLTSALAPVVTAIMMALNLRHSNIRNIMLGVLVKAITVYPMIMLLGYQGALLSSVLGTTTSIILNIIGIHRLVKIPFNHLLKLSSKVFLALSVTQLVLLVSQFAGLRIVGQSRLWSFVELGAVGLLGALIYLLITVRLNVPQSIFHKSTADLKKMVLGRRVS